MGTVFLDIDIGDQRAKYARGREFVASRHERYGLSSDDIEDLTAEEKEGLYELYGEDPEFSQKGPMAASPPPPGRIEIDLFDDCPNAAANFRRLCVGEEGKRGTSLHYKGCSFFRVIKGAFAQSGDFIKNTGVGGESVFGKPFKDEKPGLRREHIRGTVSMANSGKDTNTSQFFISFGRNSQLDGKHVAFGQCRKVSDQAIRALEECGAESDSSSEAPHSDIRIVECGLLK